MVQCSVAANAVDPARHRVGIAKRWKLSPDSDVAFLQDILSICGIVQDSEGHSVGRWSRSCDELLIGRFVSVRRLYG